MTQMVKTLPAMQETQVQSLSLEDPLKKVMATTPVFLAFPGGSDGKDSACNVGYLGLIPGLGRSSGGENATHSSILAWRIPMNRESWQVTVHGITKSQARLSN